MKHKKITIPFVLLVISCLTKPVKATEDSDLALFFSESALVETTSRHPKPLADVAENISIVSSAQINAMNAHTIYEVLNRVPGLFIAFDGNDFGSHASASIHGMAFADQPRLVFLLDGIRLNNVNNGIAILNGLPVAIIDRLEIIKGPASSVWGSSIGGVVNIITKDGEQSRRLGGEVSATYGAQDSRDLRAEVDGKVWDQTYYLFAGNQHSDGLVGNRYFDNNQVFAKTVCNFSPDNTLTIRGGTYEPEWKYGDFPLADQRSTGETKNGFVAASFSSALSQALQLYVDASLVTFDFTTDSEVLGVGILGMAGDPILQQDWEERRISFGTHLAYSLDSQVIVLGAEAWHEQLDYSLAAGQVAVASFGLPEEYRADRAENENYAVYGSDTLYLADLTLTPGIRYDYNSISGGFISPSLGATHPVADNTRLRLTLARGFSTPYLSLLREVTPFAISNPDLDPETIWSAQAGLETKAVPLLLAKASVFYHHIDDIWGIDEAGQHVNLGTTRRSGFELELETAPRHQFSVGTAFTYTQDDPEDGKTDDFSKGSVKLSYRNPSLVEVELFGSYVHWLDSQTFNGEDDNFLWDLHVRRSFSLGQDMETDLFLTLHNLTDEEQYVHAFYPNPGRWLEVGLRLRF